MTRLNSSKDPLTKALAKVRIALNRGSEPDAKRAIAELDGTAASYGHLMLAGFYRKIRRNVHAMQALQVAERIGGGNVPIDVFYGLADLALHVKNGADGLSAADRGLVQYPQDRGLLLRRAHALLQLDRLPEGFARLLDASEGTTWRPSEDAALGGAIMVAMSKDVTASCHVLEEIVRRRPTAGYPMRFLGAALHRLKRFDDAIAAFRQALDLLPDGRVRSLAIEGLQRSLQAAGLPHEDVPPREMGAPSLNCRPFLMLAITNVYNERFNLPIWLNHYGRQVGIENCLVLDNGSDDGSTDNLSGAGRLLMPRRQKYNEAHRMRLINNIANDMLNYYDAIVYSDCDEMVVADPARYRNLVDYASQMKTPTVNCIGLNIRQDITVDPPIDRGRPILCQRRLVEFTSAMCKPLIIRKPISWAGGFHSSDHPPVFGDAYLFHLRHADLGQAMDRLKTTREIEFAREISGRHHRRDDIELATSKYARTKKMKVIDDFEFTTFTRRHLDGMEFMGSGRYGIVRSVSSGSLFTIPERFRYIF